MNKSVNWEYSPAPESIDHIQLKNQYNLFINGEFVPAYQKKYFDSINPANEKVIAKIAEADDSDVNKAVVAARNAYKKTW